MGIIANGAQTIPPQQGVLHSMLWSLERDNQLRTLLASGLHRAIPPGWLTSAQLATNGGLSVRIPPGNVLYVGGLAFLLDADLICNDCADNATNTLWATIVPTRATQTNPTALDTYSVQLTSTQNGAAPTGGLLPGDAYARSGVAVTAGGVLVSITQTVDLALASAQPYAQWARGFLLMGG